MITIERLTKSNSKEKLADIAKAHDITRCFFGNPYVMHSFLNLNGPFLCTISNGTETYLIVHKKMKNEYRFLFTTPRKEFVDELVKDEHARYIATNFLPERTGAEFWMDEEEMILDVDSIIGLGDHDFRKEYHRAMRKNPVFEISKYEPKRDIGDLVGFLEEWRWGRTDEQNDIAAIENDLNFLASWGKEVTTKGVVIRHEGHVIAYCLYVPYFDKTCTSVFSKILRGYESLGVVLTVEKCKAMKADGFDFAYLANLNNDFKKSLKWAGTTFTLYAERVYKDESMTFLHVPEKYLNSARM